MKHKHAELIKAWADGARIQTLDSNTWVDVPRPSWGDGITYRIKPEPKPDICTYLTVSLEHTGRQTNLHYLSDNVKFTYDGETGKLKSAEVLR